MSAARLPRVGEMVHYRHRGEMRYRGEIVTGIILRAAVITEVSEDKESVGLAVVMPKETQYISLATGGVPCDMSHPPAYRAEETWSWTE